MLCGFQIGCAQIILTHWKERTNKSILFLVPYTDPLVSILVGFPRK